MENPIGTRRIWAIFALALVLRLIHAALLSRSPLFDFRLGDAQTYDAWAREIAAGDWIGKRAFYQAPLYPYFLAAIQAVFGDGSWVLRICQAVAGSFSCVLLAAAGSRFFSPRVGCLAGVLLAFYPSAIFFDALVQKSVLDSLLFCLLLFLAADLQLRPRGSRWLAAGAALGLLVLVRENALIFVPALLVWIAVVFRPAGRRRRVFAGLLLTGLAAVLLPVALRNLAVSGELHLTTAQLGPNLYIGNNANADGRVTPLRRHRSNPLFERDDATELAERALGRELTAGEVSTYWTGEAWRYVRSEPLDWLRLTGRKLVLFVNAVEVMDTEDQYTHAEVSPLLGLSGAVFHFGILAPFAVAGIFVARGDRRRQLLLHILGATYLASLLPFFVLARYRFPLVPILILFAAAGLAGAVDFWKKASPRRIVAATVATLATVFVCNLPLVSVDEQRGATRFNIGAALGRRERYDEAIEAYRAALELRPDFAVAHVNLGALLRDRGETDAAVEHLEAAIRAQPEAVEAHYNLALTRAARGENARAIEQYLRTLDIDPAHEQALNNLANLLLARGDLAAAIRYYRQALILDDSYVAAHYNLAVALGRSGDRPAAIRHLERVLELEPDHAGALRLLAALGPT